MSDKSSMNSVEKRIQDLENEIARLRENGKLLKESRNELAEIFDLSLDMLCIADINTTKFLKVNPAFTTILGYSEKELLDHSFLEFIHPGDMKQTVAIIDEKLKAGIKVINFANRYRCANGNYRWLEWVSHPQLERGVTFAVAHDITERQSTEKVLQENEVFIRTVMDNLPIGIAVNSVAPSVQFEYINDNFFKYYRTTKEALANPDGFWDAVYENPQFREEMKRRVLKDCASGDPARMLWKDVPIGRKGEETTFITASNTPIPDKGLMISTVWDVTDRIKTESELRDTKRLLEETQSITRLGGWEFNVRTQRLTWTDEVFRIHGLEPKSGSVDIHSALEHYAPDDLPMMKQAFQRAVDEGKPYDLELELIRKDGRRIWVRTIGHPVKADGRVVRVTGNILDITGRKQAEKDREKLQAQLLQAQKMESVGRLAGGIAHDFNNMLGVILGYGELSLERLEPNHPIRPDLEEIIKAAQHSANLTRQLLTFARKQIVTLKIVDINNAIAGMLNMLQRLIGEDIDLNWAPGAEPWPVRMDPGQIDQIIANLCVNARDAITGVGKITIETRNVSFDGDYCDNHPGFSNGDYILIAVSDNGCGMDNETINRLFEPFFTTKGLGKGTGLGLATVYGIVKQNQGFVNVYSEIEKGTTFKIYLPRYMGSVEKRIEPGISTISDQCNQETILVVEDELSNLNLFRKMLERLEYTVLTAETPSKAIALAKDHEGEIHLVITDVVMPQMNGKELSKQLLLLYPNLKFLFMSGYTANVIAHHGVLEEGVNFIEKPFSQKGLSVKIRTVLEAKNT